MPIYEYKARDAGDKVVSGRMEASTESELVKKLKGMDYVVTSISEVRHKKSLGFGREEGRIRRKDMLRFTLKLANMLQVGISLPNSIRILRDQMANQRFRRILDSLYGNISSGTAFSASLSCYPNVFPSLMVRMVEVGEASGELTEVLAQYAEYAENQENIKSKIKSALTYPMAVVSMIIVIVYIFLTFVIPRFMVVFQKANVALPLPTRVLIGMSNFARNYWLHTLIFVIVIVIGYRISSRVLIFKRLIDAIKLKIPIVSDLLRKMILASFAETLGVMYQAGVPILESLRVAEGVVGNILYSRAVRELQNHVKDGKRISEYIGGNPLFNPEITEMVNVGETTGRLSEMLRKTSFFYYKEVDTIVKNLVSLFEPLLICLLGICVGFLALAIVMPIFSMMKAIG